ncbi:MAG: hypothetical protein WKF30_15945 [Pyrinomonadaceae bacterium]
MAGAILIPIIATTVASIFVYRHTPRRRKLQAASTALLTCFLTLTVVISAALMTGRRAPGSSAIFRSIFRSIFPLQHPNARRRNSVGFLLKMCFLRRHRKRCGVASH